MKLVRMPTDLLHIEDSGLDVLDVDPELLSSFREQLTHVLESSIDVAILAPATMGTRAILMLLARRIGARLRDDNIQRRERGENLQSGRKKLCYLPGRLLVPALGDLVARQALIVEAAVFVQDLDEIGLHTDADFAPFSPVTLFQKRRATGRVSLVSADPRRLSSELEQELRAHMLVIEPG